MMSPEPFTFEGRKSESLDVPGASTDLATHRFSPTALSVPRAFRGTPERTALRTVEGGVLAAAEARHDRTFRQL